MYLSKRKGIYCIYYRQPNGKMTSKSTGAKNKSDALLFLTNFQESLNKERTEGILFKDLIFRFLKHSESIHKWNHTKTLRVSLNQAAKYFGNISIYNFNAILIQEYIGYRSKRVSVYSVRRDIATLSNILNYAITLEYIKDNPISKIKKPTIPEQQPMFFSESEYEQFINSIDIKDFKDMVTVAVNTGLRQMELLTITKEQIDLISNVITLDNRNHITKTKKIRVIPMNRQVREILQRRIELEKIFPFTQQQTVKLFQKYRRKSEIRSELTFHSLRHTFASWLVQKGVSIYHVSKLLGHASVKTTEIYSHLNNSDLKASVELLE